jgi:L-cysteine S-thiosulfotransferase
VKRIVSFFIAFLAGLPWIAWGQAVQPPWPTDNRLSGQAFLTPGLLQLQADHTNGPIALWLERGRMAWADDSAGPSCQSCHSTPAQLRPAVAAYPRLVATEAGSRLHNLEDQVLACRTRHSWPGQGATPRATPRLESDDILALSALLHDAAKGLPMRPATPPAPQRELWDSHLAKGAELFATRIGRLNLACVHCHEQNIGKQMRIDVVSPGHPTGFPIYRMAWQNLGSLERRLRACYSGVQAVIPPPGAAELRDLELYLKVRASGMPLEGPSIRR